ncbi:MAG: hypothetical protein EU532_04250 [Promethearchaeota archaeon]|nr:MAG: hypothetical protein EU532_04250 [Candidatus Lokiarchaeota archaeon]
MERIIIVHWNKSTGPEPIIQYPPEQKFPSNDLFLKIWALHELDKESSIIEFIPEINEEQYFSIIQKYEGEIYFIIIVYNRRDKIRDMITDHPDILAIVSKNLIELINTNKITRTISEAFHTIKNYTKLEKEENLLNFFRDKIKFIILNILQEGVISKDKLSEILRQEYGFSTTNIDLLLISFIREDLIIKRNVPGSQECYFLIKDLSCIRIPPKNFPEAYRENYELLNDYKESIVKFFANYDCISEIENKTIINFLMNKEVYSLLEKLRKESLSVSNCLDILNNKEDLFNELLQKKLLYEARGVVHLFSDIRFIKFAPLYVIEKLSKRYNRQEISLNEYLTHIKLLISQYEKGKSILDYEII